MSDDAIMILVYVVCKDVAEAKSIGRYLLERRLIACINTFPIQSAYWWEGQIVEDEEAVLIAKTVGRNFEAVKNEVLARHSYTVPCIIKLPVASAEDKYFNWLRGEIK